MALSVNYCYEFVLKLMKKNQAGGMGRSDFEYQWNASQASFQEDLLGRWQARNNGKTGANTGLIEDETILQKLSPFTKASNLTITSGNADKPTDFVYRLALRINGYDAYKINHSQIANVNNSVIDTPSTTNNAFYFVEYEDYYYFLPRTLPTVSITTAQLDYIMTAPEVKWGFTYDANGREVYNPGTSIQPMWSSNDCKEITERMLKTLGVAFKDSDFAGFGQSVITTGA